MKHFRDLVLSTKEPVLHNVLWIKPTGIATYIVYMYEDGWKPLFGGNSGDGGINYKILETTSDGYIVQFVDERDPNNVKNLYPKTKAIQVWLSNGVNVEDAINNINRTLSQISLMIKKAKFVTQELLNNEDVRRNNTYWVYELYDENTGQYVGLNFIRKYTTESAYNSISLATADILMNIKPASARLAYVESMIMGSTGRIANVLLVATQKDLNIQINALISRMINDVQVDGNSVVNNGIANIKPSKRVVYIVTSDIFSTDYPEGEARANKTFLIRTIGGHPTDNISLLKYDSTGLEANMTTIDLTYGDLLFNVDEHNINNDNIIPYTLYIYDTPQSSIKVHPIATKTLVDQWVGNSITDAVDSVRNVYIDFEIGEEDEQSRPDLNRRMWSATTTATVEQIKSYFDSGRNVYAKLVNPPYTTLYDGPQILRLTRCETGGHPGEFKTVHFTATLIRTGGYICTYDLTFRTGSWSLWEVSAAPRYPNDTVPTEDSVNYINSGALYDVFNDYVLLDSTKSNQSTSYNDRMAGTPKYQRAEWIEGEQEDGVIKVNPDHPTTPERRFEAMWWAIYNCHQTTLTSDTYTPKIILFNGIPACFSDTDNYTNPTNAIRITLKFFDGTKVTTYVLTKARDSNNQIMLNVTTTVQNVTLT